MDHDALLLASSFHDLVTWLREVGTLGVPAFRKLFEEPIVPVAGTAVDLFPMVLMLGFLALGTLATGTLRRRQGARRVVQAASTIAFVLGIHPCLCMIRDVALGATMLSGNTLDAFKHLMVFCAVASFALVFGRIFCGWVCPLGFFQELSFTGFQWARLHRWRALAGLLLLGGLAACLVGLGALGLMVVLPFALPVAALLVLGVRMRPDAPAAAWAKWGYLVGLLAYVVAILLVLRPATFAFAGTVAVWWAMALLVLALFVVGEPEMDSRLKPVKFLSALLLVMVLLTGIYTNGPYCIFVQSEVDLGTVLSAMVVILAAGVISSAWCRYLCPEGAVLGWLARHSRWKIVWAESRCDACRACEPVCPVEAIRSGQYDPTTCIFCSRCVEVCPREALRIEAAGAPHPQSRTGETPSGPPPPVP